MKRFPISEGSSASKELVVKSIDRKEKSKRYRHTYFVVFNIQRRDVFQLSYEFWETSKKVSDRMRGGKKKRGVPDQLVV